MKNKSYIFDEKKHDPTKIKRCLYTPDYVEEINNPISAVVEPDLPGSLTLDQQVRRIMERTLAKKAAQIERNSVEDIQEAWDFDIDGPEELTPFEFAADALHTQTLVVDDELPPELVPTPEPEPEAAPVDPDTSTPDPEPAGGVST